MIQIITDNLDKYKHFSKNIFAISKIDEFQSFDNFDITIIDITDSSLWYNNSDTVNINRNSDLKTINNAIQKSKKCNIAILFPQNISFHYSRTYDYNINGYKYTELLSNQYLETQYSINYNIKNISINKSEKFNCKDYKNYSMFAIKNDYKECKDDTCKRRVDFCFPYVD